MICFKHRLSSIKLSKSREYKNSEQFSKRIKVYKREYDFAFCSKTLIKINNVQEERETICQEIKD